MTRIPLGAGRLALVLLALVSFGGAALAADVRVMISGGFSEAYRVLVPAFETASGHKVLTAYGASMGTSPDAIPVRLARGEPADVLIMVGPALDDLAAKGGVLATSRVELARSGIGMAVRKGAARPDISSAEGLKRALLEAKTVAYSESASGVYISNELFARFGIVEQMKGRTRTVVGERVGNVVARGEADIGFQQISELKPIAGIDLVGPLPAEVQKITLFAAGIAAQSKEADAGRALIAFLSSPAARGIVAASGLEPVTASAAK